MLPVSLVGGICPSSLLIHLLWRRRSLWFTSWNVPTLAQMIMRTRSLIHVGWLGSASKAPPISEMGWGVLTSGGSLEEKHCSFQWKGAVEVVRSSSHDASWNSLLWEVYRGPQPGGDPGQEPEHAGVTYPIRPGNSSGSPRMSWNPWLGRGIPNSTSWLRAPISG